MRPSLYLIELESTPIYRQLQIEEALLRTDQRNICLLNQGSPPAIVMGVSGKTEELIDDDLYRNQPLPVIRRFSGGGTVVVDEETLFVSFIINSQELQLLPFPKEIMAWSALIYEKLFPKGLFRLEENDYVLGERKCGGNAQYICAKRWLHHTSFLWGWRQERMALLKMPARQPKWRCGRPHEEFICSITEGWQGSRAEFFQRLKELLSAYFSLEVFSLNEIEQILNRPHRRSTVFE